MFTIKRVSDPRLSRRILETFEVESPHAMVYGAFQGTDVLATAVFDEDADRCMVFCDLDTGRRLDVDLADGIARAAFHAGMRTGVRTARLGERLSRELRMALSKRGYALEGPFDLKTFFSKKRCG